MTTTSIVNVPDRMFHETISLNTAGTHILWTPSTDSKLVVMRLVLVTDAAVGVQLIGSDINNLTGNMRLGSISLDAFPMGNRRFVPVFFLAVDEPFRMVLDGAVQVSGVWWGFED